MIEPGITAAEGQSRYASFLSMAGRLEPEVIERGVQQHLFVQPHQRREELTLEQVIAAWRAVSGDIEAGRTPDNLSLYLHIPFCRQRCRYCIYFSVALADRRQLEPYLQRLHAEVDLFGPLLAGRQISTAYLGGGTPTMLDEQQLERLLTHVDRSFERRRGGEWAFECNPAVVTEAQVQLLVTHGFNRASFGVQSINPQVLAGVDRGYQTVAEVAATFERLHAERLWINVDLISGLPGEPTESLLASLEALLGFGPTEVTIYRLSPFTPAAARIDLPDSAEGHAEDLVARVTPIADQHGYRVHSGGTSVCLVCERGAHHWNGDNLLAQEWRRGGRSQLFYDDITLEPQSLLGLGATARSSLYGRLKYTNSRGDLAAASVPTTPYAEGRAHLLQDEQARFLITRLEQPEGLDPTEYEASFGERPELRFATTLELTAQLGLLEREPSAGPWRLRPTDPTERFAALLFFVDEARLTAAFGGARPAAPGSTRSEPPRP